MIDVSPPPRWLPPALVRLTLRAVLATAVSVAGLPIFLANGAPASAASGVSPARAVAGRTAPVDVPAQLNIFSSSLLRYQDPNYSACTAAAAQTMLNFVSHAGSGGADFRWTRSVSGTLRDSILAWERSHDTMSGGRGSDPHGWRNALNYYGWGPGSLVAGQRVYDDFSFNTYELAVKAAVRAMIMTRKPVGLLAWAGRHAQFVHGYYGLSGDPFEKDSAGRYTNRFTFSGFYLTDPLRSSKAANLRISYTNLRDTSTTRFRLRRYYETDSLLDDPYTPGTKRSVDEWYGLFVLILPVR